VLVDFVLKSINVLVDFVLKSMLLSKIFIGADRPSVPGTRSNRSHRTRHHLILPGSKAIPDGRDVREGAQSLQFSPLAFR